MHLIALLQSHDQVQLMSCSQMELVWVLAHAGILNCHINETAETCFYYLFNLWDITMQNNTTWLKLKFSLLHPLCVDNIMFIYCFSCLI